MILVDKNYALKKAENQYYLGIISEQTKIEIVKFLNNLPSVQSEQYWIPCSEKLPEEDVYVLVTDDAGGMATLSVDSCGRYEDTGERFWYTSQNVTAWMELPLPYQGEHDD